MFGQCIDKHFGNFIHKQFGQYIDNHMDQQLHVLRVHMLHCQRQLLRDRGSGPPACWKHNTVRQSIEFVCISLPTNMHDVFRHWETLLALHSHTTPLHEHCSQGAVDKSYS